MLFLNVNFENRETILQSFDRIAEKIGKDIQLKINNAVYRLVDFEFYTYSKALPDPHTYKNDLQLQNGKLYLHSSGVDITFGDTNNYGGILLRGIVKLNDGRNQENEFINSAFNGPQIVATELFSNLNSLFSSEKNDISIVDIDGHNQDACFKPALKVIKTKRVGLTSKTNDPEDYYRKLPIRYITILHKTPNFKQSIKGFEGILGEQVLDGKMTIEEANDILGYKRSF